MNIMPVPSLRALLEGQISLSGNNIFSRIFSRISTLLPYVKLAAIKPQNCYKNLNFRSLLFSTVKL